MLSNWPKSNADYALRLHQGWFRDPKTTLKSTRPAGHDASEGVTQSHQDEPTISAAAQGAALGALNRVACQLELYPALELARHQGHGPSDMR